MQRDRESPNPYQSPRTVATGERADAKREPGPKLRDLKHQTIGFAVTFAALVALVVASGAMWFTMGLSLSPRWDWVVTLLRVVAVLLGVAAFPGLVVCGPWTLISAAQWAIAARTGSTIKSEATE